MGRWGDGRWGERGCALRDFPSSILSSIFLLPSSVFSFLISDFLFLISNLKHLTPDLRLQLQSSVFRLPKSNIRHPTSNIPLPHYVAVYFRFRQYPRTSAKTNTSTTGIRVLSNCHCTRSAFTRSGSILRSFTSRERTEINPESSQR